jgi:hypothetical protein
MLLTSRPSDLDGTTVTVVLFETSGIQASLNSRTKGVLPWSQWVP